MIKSFSNISFGLTPAPQKKSGDTKLSIMYFNDFHGQSSPFERLKTQSDIFDSSHKGKEVDTLKLSAGDMNIGSKDKENSFVTKILNTLNLDATTIGNHEFDREIPSLKNYVKNALFPYLSANITIKGAEQTPNEKNIQKSTIIEKNGHKYGIIGVSPFDLKKTTEGNQLETLKIDSYEDTKKIIQHEIDELKKQGVNKIVLLAHIELAKCTEIAKQLSGIDIVVSGHSHDLIKGVVKDKNLVNSASNEPVIIVQAGKDGKYCGELDVLFDENGVLKEASNEIIPLDDEPKNLEATYLKDLTFGKPNSVAMISNNSENTNALCSEDALASLLADSTYKKIDCDFVLLNSGTIRGKLKSGLVTDRDILELVPFQNKTYKTTITEKELVDAIKHSGTTLVSKNSKPGIMQVSHLSYTMNKKGELLSLSLIDKSGKNIPIDVNNPRADKTYTTVYNGFLMDGKDDYKMLKRDRSKNQEFTQESTNFAVECLKEMNGQPFDIKEDGRIKIV